VLEVGATGEASETDEAGDAVGPGKPKGSVVDMASRRTGSAS
jgi:hypothetical protein